MITQTEQINLFLLIYFTSLDFTDVLALIFIFSRPYRNANPTRMDFDCLKRCFVFSKSLSLIRLGRRSQGVRLLLVKLHLLQLRPRKDTSYLITWMKHRIFESLLARRWRNPRQRCQVECSGFLQETSFGNKPESSSFWYGRLNVSVDQWRKRTSIQGQSRTSTRRKCYYKEEC